MTNHGASLVNTIIINRQSAKTRERTLLEPLLLEDIARNRNPNKHIYCKYFGYLIKRDLNLIKYL
jgi:hypothetical protein